MHCIRHKNKINFVYDTNYKSWETWTAIISWGKKNTFFSVIYEIKNIFIWNFYKFFKAFVYFRSVQADKAIRRKKVLYNIKK